MNRMMMKNTVFLFFLVLTSGLSLTQAAQLCQPDSIIASTKTADFIDHNDGTVTDTKTGLMWKRCSEGQTWDAVNQTCTGAASTYLWAQALVQASALNAGGGFAGFMDWRVPNVKELVSIVEEQCSGPAINLELFPQTPQLPYWTATPSATDAALAWYVRFSGGNSDFIAEDSSGQSFTKNNGFLQVRLVRGGQ